MILPGGLRKELHMHLYTVIVEFDGGTFISQIPAKSHDEALAIWGRHRTKKFNLKTRSALIKALRDGEHGLVPLERLRNTWCTSASLGDEFILINVIKTDVYADDTAESSKSQKRIIK